MKYWFLPSNLHNNVTAKISVLDPYTGYFLCNFVPLPANMSTLTHKDLVCESKNQTSIILKVKSGEQICKYVNYMQIRAFIA